MSATERIADRAVLRDVVAVDARIRCANGRIAAVATGPGAGTGAGAAERLRGTLLPGFVDLQVNGAGGRSVDEATPEALGAVAAAVRAGGAAAFLPTLITAPWQSLLEQVAAVAQWIAAWDDASRGASQAEPLGLHVEGPFLEAPGAHDGAHFLDPTEERIDALCDAARGTLKLVTLAPSRRGAAAATARLRARGVAVAIGHVVATEGLADCVAAGASAVTHLFNAMGSLHHREPGVAGLALDDVRLRCALIADGAHVHPAMLRVAFRVLGPARAFLVTDAVAAAGMPDGEYRLAGARVASKAGTVRDAEGRLAGSALTMAQAATNFRAFVPEAGPWTLAQLCAANPAALIGAGGYGAIAPGKRARFTLLGDDGSFRCVS